MQRTLKRELKDLEVVDREAIGNSSTVCRRIFPWLKSNAFTPPLCVRTPKIPFRSRGGSDASDQLCGRGHALSAFLGGEYPPVRGRSLAFLPLGDLMQPGAPSCGRGPRPSAGEIHPWSRHSTPNLSRKGSITFIGQSRWGPPFSWHQLGRARESRLLCCFHPPPAMGARALADRAELGSRPSRPRKIVLQTLKCGGRRGFFREASPSSPGVSSPTLVILRLDIRGATPPSLLFGGRYPFKARLLAGAEGNESDGGVKGPQSRSV